MLCNLVVACLKIGLGWKHGRFQTLRKIFTLGQKHGRFQTLLAGIILINDDAIMRADLSPGLQLLDDDLLSGPGQG